jgi:hypothetical protein
MGLLHDIQAAVLEDGTDLGPILLKVRLLAARLGSQPLARFQLVRSTALWYSSGLEGPWRRTRWTCEVGS